MWQLIVSIGLVFALVSATATFLIAYEEYVHHFVDRHVSVKKSLELALAAFVFMLTLSILAGFVIVRSFF